jgi:hypothetical protein
MLLKCHIVLSKPFLAVSHLSAGLAMDEVESKTNLFVNPEFILRMFATAEVRVTFAVDRSGCKGFSL